MAELSPEQRIEAYLAAYEAANGHRDVTVTYERGYYYFGEHRLHSPKRAHQLDAMAEVLRRRANG